MKLLTRTDAMLPHSLLEFLDALPFAVVLGFFAALFGVMHWVGKVYDRRATRVEERPTVYVAGRGPAVLDKSRAVGCGTAARDY